MIQDLKKNITNAARIVRSARKAMGISQVKLAKELGITQSSLSKVESCQRELTMVEWYQACEVLNLESETAFRSGFIDRCAPFMKRASGENPYHIPKKYLRYQGSKVRIIKPFLSFFENQLGTEKLEEYLQSIKVDPDFFVIYDNQLNIKFSFELLSALVKKNALNRDNLSELTATARKAEIHGNLFKDYTKQSSRKELLKKLVNQASLYEVNSRYEIIDENIESVLLQVKPASHMKFFDYRNDSLGVLTCEYKKNFIYDFLTVLPGTPIELNELECHFKGSERCLYEFRFGKI